MLEAVNNQEFLPTKKTEGSAGLDCFSNETVLIEPKKVEMVPLGFKMELRSSQYFSMLVARSSLQKKGLMLANNVGIIDNDYRGEVMAAIWNFSTKDAIINKGERIAQLVILPQTPIYVEPGIVNVTERNTGGFGSTGSY